MSTDCEHEVKVTLITRSGDVSHVHLLWCAAENSTVTESEVDTEADTDRESVVDR